MNNTDLRYDWKEMLLLFSVASLLTLFIFLFMQFY